MASAKYFHPFFLNNQTQTPSGKCELFHSWLGDSTHDFLRVSLIEAYNSLYKYDLIGIVETHIDCTVDEDRLSLDGYTFIKENHPQNVKRGGVGLYVRDSLPSKNRSDLVTLPECVVCEIELNRKKYLGIK